jgi:tRNA-specific 2-thiouridylase
VRVGETAVTRVLVAMSGGVDSSVAAALLREDGHDVVGAWMRMHDVADFASPHAKSCCSLDAADDARRVAGQLGIPFTILNMEREYAENVLDPFLAAYQAGRTPSPCVDCNTHVKFGALLAQAVRVLGCDAIATGHYARIEAIEDVAADGARRYRLLRGRDSSKDQAYFLYALRQDQLARTIFPLGQLSKPEVRALAAERGLATATKAESQELCFVPGGDYREVLKERAGWREAPGPLMDADGTVIGEHRGVAAYTVGQRQGLGVAVGEPRYVARIDAAVNLVQLGRRADLARSKFTVEAVSFVAGLPPREPAARPDGTFTAAVQIRHGAAPVPCVVRPRVANANAGTWTVETETPVWAPAPGQAAVFSAGDEIIGGGRIA